MVAKRIIISHFRIANVEHFVGNAGFVAKVVADDCVVGGIVGEQMTVVRCEGVVAYLYHVGDCDEVVGVVDVGFEEFVGVDVLHNFVGF